MLIIHIASAILSLLVASYSALRPSRQRLVIASSLSVVMLLSGTDIVVQSHAPIASACVSGLLYLAAIGCLLASSYRKLRAAGNR